MARRRTTFGKLQRDRDKQAKAKAKIERRQARAAEKTDEDDEEITTPEPEADQEKVLAELAAIHQAYDDGEMSLDDFEAKKAELTAALRID